VPVSVQPIQIGRSPAKPPRRRRGRVIAAALFVAFLLGLTGFLGIHPFLAATRRVPDARVLVVEGWVPDYALKAALSEFEQRDYERIFTTGGPLDRGSYLKEYRSFAELAAATLLSLGAPTNAVTAVPTAEQHRNRTFASAVALREYCDANDIQVEAMNLVSVGPHSRRSRLCFDRAFDGKAKVGVIAIEDDLYDPRRWWAYSAGVKSVGGETLALIYAWLSVDYGD
jgi:hypothetical protein